MSSSSSNELPFSIRAISVEDELALRELQARPEVRARIGEIVDGQADLHDRMRAIDCDGLLAGVVGVVRSGAFDGNDVELICAVRKTYENRRLATRSCRALLSDEFNTRDRVLACIKPTNTEAKSLAKRLGFLPIGTRAFSDEEIWELRAADFSALAV
jgi:RimJ/RimL family protein N-acetyltransferase